MDLTPINLGEDLPVFIAKLKVTKGESEPQTKTYLRIIDSQDNDPTSLSDFTVNDPSGVTVELVSLTKGFMSVDRTATPIDEDALLDNFGSVYQSVEEIF